MNPKILVADDSPTIQKVVSITLAGKGYDLETAHDEAELFKKLATGSFDLVLLDFNISEENSGYELATKIRDISSSTKTLVMLGTFDSVDDHSMNESGVVDQIVKPFESSLFVEKVKAALEGESNFSTEAVNLEPNESEWVMDNALSDEQEDEEEIQLEEDFNSKSNPLDEVISGWGMSVPSVIGEEEGLADLPPRMEESELESVLTSGAELIHEIQENENYEEVIGEILVPEKEELSSLSLADSEIGKIKPTSKLVSIEELDSDQLIDLDEGEEDIDDTDPQFVIGPSEDSPDLIDALEEDVTPDEFWAADEGSGFSLGESDQDDYEGDLELIDLGDDEDDFQIDQHVPVNIGAESEEISSPALDALNELSEVEAVGPKLERVESSFDYEEVISRLKTDLRPLILEIVQEAIEQSSTLAAEKVAWEIIPDLAENLIRKEVESLSKKVQEKHSLS